MNRILCPTDFSSTANNAIAYAAKFAQVTQSEIILFNVQSFFDLPPNELLAGKSEKIEHIKMMLESQALEIARTFSISCYADLQVSGIALSAIINHAAADFDLIIMGTNGPDDMYQFLSGSNTYNVIRKATIPVLLVPSSATFNGINLAVLAYDYLRAGMPPVKQVLNVLDPFTYKLFLLQLLEESYSPIQDEELKEREEQILDLLPTEINIGFDSLHTDNLLQALGNYMRTSKADVLILSSMQYSIIRRVFHKRVIKAVSKVADFPVLVIHANSL